MTGVVRERLQNQSCGCSFAARSMNDFPIPEDPPVITTAEKVWSASRGEGTSLRLKYFSQGGWSALAALKPNHNAAS